MNPSRDCHLRTHKILRKHTRISARAYILRLNNVSDVAAGRTMCHAGTKSARSSIAPLSEPQWGLPLTEPPSPYSHDYNRRSRSDGRKLSTQSTFRTLAERRGEPSTNLLAGQDAPPACAPSQQIPSPRNWWRTGHTRLATASPPGSSTNSCPTYGRTFPMEEDWESQYLRTFQAGRVCCCPQTPEARKISGTGLHLPGAYTIHGGSALKS